MLINEGKYPARVIEYQHGISPNTGTEFIRVYFRIETAGRENGQVMRWDGWLTGAAMAQTMRSLTNAGWDGVSLSKPEGLGSTACELDIIHEENEADGKTYARVNWVNAPFRLPDNMLMPGHVVDTLDARLAAYRAKAARQEAGLVPVSAGAPPDDDDIPF